MGKELKTGSLKSGSLRGKFKSESLPSNKVVSTVTKRV